MEKVIIYPTGNDRSYVTFQVAEYFSEGNESEITEYKQLWRSDFLKVISAFANTNGGVLYIGLDDRGKPVGLQSIKKLLEDIPNTIRNKLGIIVSVVLEEIEEKQTIKITVPSSEAPVSWKGSFYVRSRSTVQELMGSNLARFLMRKLHCTWEEEVEESVDLNSSTIESFRRLAAERVPSVSVETDENILLDKLNLLNDGLMTRAAVLLFGKEPQRVHQNAVLKIGKFLSETDIQSTDIIKGNLFQQLDTTLEVLRLKYLMTYTHFEGLHRIDTLEYPYEALREAVINALIHRDYFSTVETQIRVYPNKLVIMNAGKLPDEISLSSLKGKHVSKPANPRLATVFHHAGFIERWGYGTVRIVEQCQKFGLPEPDFEQSENTIIVTLYKNMLSEECLDKLRLNRRQKKTIQKLKETGSINNRQYRNLYGVSERTATRDLGALLSWGVLETPGTIGMAVTYSLRTRYDAFSKILHKPAILDKTENSIQKKGTEGSLDSVAVEQNRKELQRNSIYPIHEGAGATFPPNTDQVAPHVTDQDKALLSSIQNRLIAVLDGEKTRIELMKLLNITNRKSFMSNYLEPSVASGYIQMTIPENPQSVKQKYCLTYLGEKLKSEITDQVTPHVTEHVTEHVMHLLMLLTKEMSRIELMDLMRLIHRPSFIENYLHPALKLKLIEMTIPDKPRSVNQKYRLTSQGKKLQKKLKTDK